MCKIYVTPITKQDREAKRKELERQIDRNRKEFITHINRFRLQRKYNRDARKTPNPPETAWTACG